MVEKDSKDISWISDTLINKCLETEKENARGRSLTTPGRLHLQVTCTKGTKVNSASNREIVFFAVKRTECFGVPRKKFVFKTKTINTPLKVGMGGRNVNLNVAGKSFRCLAFAVSHAIARDTTSSTEIQFDFHNSTVQFS